LYTFLLAPISRELGLGREAHAVLLGASLGATAMGGALFGYLGDRFGRKAVLEWSILTYSAGTVLCGLAPEVATLLAARVVTGLGVGGEWAIGHALLGETVPPRLRGRFGALLQTGAPAGVGLAAIGGSFVGPHVGWRALDRQLGAQDPGRRVRRAARVRVLRPRLGPGRSEAGVLALRHADGRRAGVDHAPLAGHRGVAPSPSLLPLDRRLRDGHVVQLRTDVRRAVPHAAAHDGRGDGVQCGPRGAARDAARGRGRGPEPRPRRRHHDRRGLRGRRRGLGVAAPGDARAAARAGVSRARRTSGRAAGAPYGQPSKPAGGARSDCSASLERRRLIRSATSF